MKRVLVTFSLVFVLEPVMTVLTHVLLFGFMVPKQQMRGEYDREMN